MNIVHIIRKQWIGIVRSDVLATKACIRGLFVISLRWGFWEASLTSVFSVLCLDYFFTQPLFALYMSDAHDWVAMGTFETVSLLVSRLSNQTRQHGAEVETQRERMEKLYELSQNVLLLDQQQPASAQMCVLVRRALSLDFVAIWDAAAAMAFLSESDDRAREEVRAIYAAHFEGDDLASGYSRRLLRTGERVVGAMLARSSAIDSRSIDAAGSLTALAIERSRAYAAESASEGARQSEQLRSAVLDGLAHAFKTPLTTILASSSGLIEMGTIGATERELVALIEAEAAHLNELTARLLTTARLDSAHIRLAKQEVDLVELLRGLARVCADENSAVEVALEVPTHASSILADFHLLKMALYHLVDNGAKYAKPGSRIEMYLRPKYLLTEPYIGYRFAESISED